jgi:hypothetical protein
MLVTAKTTCLSSLILYTSLPVVIHTGLYVLCSTFIHVLLSVEEKFHCHKVFDTALYVTVTLHLCYIFNTISIIIFICIVT